MFYSLPYTSSIYIILIMLVGWSVMTLNYFFKSEDNVKARSSQWCLARSSQWCSEYNVKARSSVWCPVCQWFWLVPGRVLEVGSRVLVIDYDTVVIVEAVQLLNGNTSYTKSNQIVSNPILKYNFNFLYKKLAQTDRKFIRFQRYRHRVFFMNSLIIIVYLFVLLFEYEMLMYPKKNC